MFAVRRVAETDSTNDDASALLGQPGTGGLVLLADFQRAGRGRHARSWIAPPGTSLLFTAILPQALETRALWALPFWTALCVADGIAEASGIRVDLQWPNDLLIDGRKCCGILCVSRIMGDLAWVGCGVGLNVVRPEDDAELATVAPAPAFLSDERPGVTRDSTFDTILGAFERRLGELATPANVARAWEARASLAGTRYRVARDGDPAPFEARALRIGDDGSLVVERNGSEERLSLGDVRVLRG